MQLLLLPATPATNSIRQQLEQKALEHCKVSGKYRKRIDAIEQAVSQLQLMAEQRGLQFYRSDIRPISARAAKSTKYTVQCRIGSGDLVPTVTFRDSLNGESCTFIDFGIYRKVCSNGLHIATNNEQVFKQNHLSEWQLDKYQVAAIFDKAIDILDKVVAKYTGFSVPEGQSAYNMRNQLLERLATNGLITISQAATARKYNMRYYDNRGDLFGVINAVQESLTTNRNGQKKHTDANATLNRKLIPAIDRALVELYSIAA